MNKITREQMAAMIAAIPSGQVFRVVFVKRSDKSDREMLAQKGVRKHLQDGEAAYDFREHQLLPVWDTQARGYRSIPYEGLKELTTSGETYHV